MPANAHYLIANFAALALACGHFGIGFAQVVYKSVGPDGRTVYSDVPPAGAPAPVPGSGNTAAAPGRLSDGLPYALRQTVERYPVTLYTGKDCPPCDAARALLSSRGVPYAERTVSTNDDIAALQSLSGEGRLPFATIGPKPLKGYSSATWAEYLDAAGYDRSITLPASYRNGTATPLTVPKPAASAPMAGSEPPLVIPMYR